MRKLTAVILTLCLLLGSVVPSFATVPVSDFTDVSSSDWFYTYVKWGVDNDYFAGTSATTFSPNDPSTREQFMKVFANYAGEKKLNNNVSVFADVESGRWSAGAIKWALDKSITAGVGGGKFNPTGDITRQQAAVFVANFAKWYCATTGKTLKEAVRPAAFSDADSIAAFAESSVDYCVDHGLLAGYPDGTFKPGKIVTRAEFATILHAMEFILGVHTSGGGGGGTTTTYVYSITYDLDGGAWATGVADQNEKTSAMTATSYDFTVTAEVPEKAGYIFDHWENQADGSTVAAGDTLTATKDAKDITVKAIYIDANDLILLGVKAAADSAAGYIDAANNIADIVNNADFGIEGVIDSIGYDENGAAEDNSAALEDAHRQVIISGTIRSTAGDFIEKAIESATRAALGMGIYDPEGTAPYTLGDVEDVLNAVADAILGKDEFKKDLKAGDKNAIAKAIYEDLKAQWKDEAKDIWGNMRNDNDSATYPFGTLTVKAPSGTDLATITTGADKNNASLASPAALEAVKAIAKEIGKQYAAAIKEAGSDGPTDFMTIDACVVLFFDDVVTKCTPFPVYYDVMVELNLDANGEVFYEYTGGEHILTVHVDKPGDPEEVLLTLASQLPGSKFESRIISVANTMIEGMNVTNLDGSDITFSNLEEVIDFIDNPPAVRRGEKTLTEAGAKAVLLEELPYRAVAKVNSKLPASIVSKLHVGYEEYMVCAILAALGSTSFEAEASNYLATYVDPQTLEDVPYDFEAAATSTINSFKNGDVAALLQAGIDNATVKKVLGPYVSKAVNAAKKVVKIADMLDGATIAIAGGGEITADDFKAFAAAADTDAAFAAAKAVADKIGSFSYNDLITNGVEIKGSFDGKTVAVKIVLAWD